MYYLVADGFTKENFILWIKNDGSLPSTVDLSQFSPNDCTGQKTNFVSLSIKDLSGTSYFQAAGTIDISSFDANGNLSAPIENVKLIEYEVDDVLFDFLQPVENGKCIEITNKTLNYVAD